MVRDLAVAIALLRVDVAACPSGCEQFQVVGFASYEQPRDVRWVFVALRRIADGVLGVYAHWKFNYGPTDHLSAKV